MGGGSGRASARTRRGTRTPASSAFGRGCKTPRRTRTGSPRPRRAWRTSRGGPDPASVERKCSRPRRCPSTAPPRSCCTSRRAGPTPPVVLARVLAAAVRVRHQARRRPPPRHRQVERIDHQPARHRRRHRPPHDPPAEKVQHGGLIVAERPARRGAVTPPARTPSGGDGSRRPAGGDHSGVGRIASAAARRRPPRASAGSGGGSRRVIPGVGRRPLRPVPEGDRAALGPRAELAVRRVRFDGVREVRHRRDDRGRRHADNGMRMKGRGPRGGRRARRGAVRRTGPAARTAREDR